MKKYAAFLAAIIGLMGFTAVANMPQADAASAPYPNPSPGTEVASASPSAVSVGGSTVVTICTGSIPRHIVPSGLIDPVGAPFGSPTPVVILPPDHCVDYFVGGGFGPTDYPGVPSLTSTGNWVAFYDDTLNGNSFVVDFAVSFFVVPESPIGALAIIGSSMAALGAFVGLKRYKAKI